MTTYGITATGFVKKPLLVIKADLEDSWRTQFGNDADLSPQSPDGQVVGIMAERIADLWDLAEGIYASRDPDQAGGSALDAVCALTGTNRQPAKKSTVLLSFSTTSDTLPVTVPANTVVSIAGVNKFTTLAAGTPVLGFDVAGLGGGLAYALGDYCWTEAAAVFRVYRCIVAGGNNSAVGDIVSGSEAAVIVDGDVTWTYVGRGTGGVDIAAESLDYGTIAAPARTLTTIETPVLDLLGVVNVYDAVLGQVSEVDPLLRIRREDELRATGNAAADAIRSDVLQVGQSTTNPVTGCTVLINDTDATDANGVPPHAVEVLVLGGEDQSVIDAIFASLGAGIATYGTTSGTAVDAAGQSHTVLFSRPTEKTVYVAATVKYDARTYPSDGDAQVKAAMVAAGALSAVGQDVVSAYLSAQAFKVPGVLDCRPCYIKLSAGPTAETTLAISLRELATYDTGRIAITSTPAVP